LVTVVERAKRCVASVLRGVAERLDPQDLEGALRLVGWERTGACWTFTGRDPDAPVTVRHEGNGGV
jgi:hypothetical protein